MEDECEVEIEVVELPSEHRVVAWDDGDHCIFKVYLKDGKPWVYDDCGSVFDCFYALPSREALEAAGLEMGAAIAHAISLPTLSEADDFPGQERQDWSSLQSAWLKRQQESSQRNFDDDGE